MLSKIAQLFIGIVLGLLVVAGVLAGAGYLYFKPYAEGPANPTFSNDADGPETPPFDPYAAKVTYDQGLFLRADPTKESERLKVLTFGQELTVLDISEDEKFDKVNVEIEGETLEGWVSAGNIERLDEPEDAESQE